MHRVREGARVGDKRAHTHTHTVTHTYTLSCTHTHAHTHTLVHTHTYTHTRVYMCAFEQSAHPLIHMQRGRLVVHRVGEEARVGHEADVAKIIRLKSALPGRAVVLRIPPAAQHIFIYLCIR